VFRRHLERKKDRNQLVSEMSRVCMFRSHIQNDEVNCPATCESNEEKQRGRELFVMDRPNKNGFPKLLQIHCVSYLV